MSRLVHKYLEGLRDVLTYMSTPSGLEPSCVSVAPWLLMVFLVANSRSFLPPLVASAYSLVVYALTFKGRLRKEVEPLIRSLAYILALATIVALPLLLWSPRADVYMFIFRVVSSTFTFTTLARVIGVRQVIGFARLVRIPTILVDALRYTVAFIPVFLNDTLKLLMAREARPSLDSGISSVWRRIATVASEAMLRSYSRAHTLSLTLKARSMSSRWGGNVGCLGGGAGVFEFSLFAVTAVAFVLEVASWLQA